MNEDLLGRIENTSLPASRPLLPLFDAIINAIHAIEDAKAAKQLIGNGQIAVTVERDRSQGQGELLGVQTDEPVAGFVIEDDGIGFNDANRTSFDTADSRYKRDRGSKGVGRFLWLKSFKDIHVASTFVEPDGFPQRREFDFRLPNGIESETLQAASGADVAPGTRVTLAGYEARYRQQCPKSLDAIAHRMIEHCLVFLLRQDAPTITLKDYRHTLSLNERVREQQLLADTAQDSFQVKGESLSVRHFHFRARSTKPRIHYVGDNREVLSEAPASADLAQRLPDHDGSTFALVSYVSGQILDRHLNAERTGFTLPSREDAPLLTEHVTLEDIKEAAQAKVAEHAAPYVAPLREQKMQQIQAFINAEAPQYKPLLNRHREQLGQIAPGLAPEKLEVELHKIRARLTTDTKESVAKLLTVTDYAGYEERFQEVLEQLNDVGKVALIENVVHRRLVLEILSKHLQRRADGQPGHYLEEDIHNIIFPMRTTSDDVEFEEQNLWIIDEKLTYHRYLASDKKLSEMKPLETLDEDRPDVVIWNNPMAVSDDVVASPQQAITIIEFKRPMRSGSYPPGDTPVEQVLRYVQKIQENRALDRTGRPVRVHGSSPFYAYVLCDIVPALRERLLNINFIEMPDGMGFFLYNQNRRAWIEVLSYDKIVSDARKRNRALFDALHLPTA